MISLEIAQCCLIVEFKTSRLSYTNCETINQRVYSTFHAAPFAHGFYGIYVAPWLGASVVGASMTARTAVVETALWRCGVVAEWKSGRVAGGFSEAGFSGQGDSRFSFSSAFLLIYLSLDFPPVLRLHSDHLLVFLIFWR